VAEGRVIAIVGAESTGKTTLAGALQRALAAHGRRVALVGEYLREFCAREGRTPSAAEQPSIAREQSARIAAAAAAHELVIADTTALMTAVYSHHLFGDPTLLDAALGQQARCHLTLLTTLDLPWVPDGLQRDGAHLRAPIEAALRSALVDAGLAFAVVSGSGEARTGAALAAVHSALRPRPAPGAARWRHLCEHCGDPDCERHLLAR
jgi:nicotinamide riboside kinase